MTEEPGEEKSEEQLTEEPSQAPQHEAPTHPQVVEIKTPLDRPEFDWFLETFMNKMGLSDRKQAAIMLTNMMYDMGLDPYSELKDLQGAMEEMNTMFKNLPSTPTAMKVKDTVGGMFAAKAGRAIIERFPRVGGQDPMMDKMERIMDKYMPMIMGMKMVAEMMRAEPGQSKEQAKATTELPEAVKTEIAELKQSVAGITDLLSKQRENEDKRAFAQEVVNSVNSGITPQLQALQGQIDNLAKQPPPPGVPDKTNELREISTALKEAVDKLGEKAGQKNLTLADVNPLLEVIDHIEEKFRKEPAGEFDWRTATVSTIGETMKEAISAYRDVAQAKAATPVPGQLRAPTPANTEMQTIIMKQVQNYILQRLQTGAATMNIQEAAQTLGLTPEQVAWAYQTLTAEGWINVKVPGQQKGKGVNENVQTQGETGQETEAGKPFVET